MTAENSNKLKLKTYTSTRKSTLSLVTLQSFSISDVHGSYNLEKVLNFSSRLEKSLNSVKVLEKYLISLLGLEKSLKFPNLFIPYHFSEK